ncbi:MAG: hypothetical protein AAF542_09740 [Pseudomonadota bacterium]
MQTSLLHIVQTELSQNRCEQLIDALGEHDAVVVVQKQAKLITALKSASYGALYALYDVRSDEVSVLHPIEYCMFVELITQFSQSRSW